MLQRPNRHPRSKESGAALLLSLFVLIVILAVVFQIKISTSTEARVARNDIGITRMDLAIESVMLEYFDLLAADAEAGAAGSDPAAGDAGADALGALAAGAGGDGGGEDGAGGGDEGPNDSRQDDWARSDAYDVGGIELEVFVQPENSKYNVLAMLTENDDEAEKAFERVVNVIDLYREGTDWDVDRNDARSMAEAMLDHMSDRDRSFLPRPNLLTDDDEEEEDIGLPLSLREFIVLDPFEPVHFQDFIDEDDTRIHSLESFLTVWTSVQTFADRERADEAAPGAGGGGEDGEGEDDGGDGGSGSGGSGGGDVPGGNLGGGRTIGGASGVEEDAGNLPGAPGGGGSGGGGVGHRINVNFAPKAVLFALMERDEVPSTFWDDLVEYRNEPDEELIDEDDDSDPIVDRFGNEIEPKLFFKSLEDLSELDDWNSLEPIVQTELQDLLTVQSDVFSIVLIARRPTGEEGSNFDWTDPDAVAEQHESGGNLVRVVRTVVWRTQGEDGSELVPLQRWDVLGHRFLEVDDGVED